jgi:23S rRNA (uracil1939-C5)-methyltransferase
LEGEALCVGDVLEVEIEKGVYRGLGLSRHAGRIVFVRRGLPGDRLRVRVDQVSPGYVRASALEILSPGAAGRAPPCAFFEKCGGCAYQGLGYAAQLALKEGVLRESLARAGIPWDGALPLHASPEQGWRMRASFHVQTRGGEVSLGLREEGTHRVVDLPRCLQLSEAMNRTLRALLAGLDERRHLARRIHGVELAESLDGKQLVACLDSELSPREAPGLTALAERAPGLTGFGIVAGVEGRRRFLSLKGDPHVEATVLGLRLRSHVRSFFQANRFLVEDLVREVASRVPPGGTVLDLYAGVGLFALPLAQAAERVLGVELNPTAVEDAASNARANGIDNARIRQGDVRDGLAAWRVEGEERIVLDPPRTGAGAAVVGAIVSRRPAAVVYVACDPPTLARDLKAFGEAGYRLAALTAFDLFPDTFHVETVAQLLPE